MPDVCCLPTTCSLLPPGKQEMETISFQFSLGSTVLNREIPAGAVALTRNQQLTVKGELIGDGTFVPEEPNRLNFHK